MADAFSAYDVLAKRDTPSWNERTRDVINKRLALAIAENVLGDTQLATLRVIVARVCPDPPDRPATNTLAMIVRKIAEDEGDGYRPNTSPRTAECWRRGLDAIEDEARLRFNCGFARIEPDQADEILYAVESGKVRSVLWGNLSPELFWKWRLLPDLVSSHWAQPSRDALRQRHCVRVGRVPRWALQRRVPRRRLRRRPNLRSLVHGGSL